ETAPKPILKPTPAQKPSSSLQRPSTSYERTSSQPASSSSYRSPQAPSTAPPAKPTPAASSSSQVRQNYRSGREFQESVHASLRIPENKMPYGVLLRDKGKVSTIPDLPLPSAGVTEIKNVRYITFTKQLQAQEALAREKGKSFNLVISPNTKRISKQVWDAVGESGGKIFEFNPATEKWIERIVEGNIVLR
ncbi:MAG: hypothetical protein K2X02_04245, partial [Alphaproteobacteria bacterium]|nr:hypothetical protein [Alphaproteobacteria bacterium]